MILKIAAMSTISRSIRKRKKKQDEEIYSAGLAHFFFESLRVRLLPGGLGDDRGIIRVLFVDHQQSGGRGGDRSTGGERRRERKIEGIVGSRSRRRGRRRMSRGNGENRLRLRSTQTDFTRAKLRRIRTLTCRIRMTEISHLERRTVVPSNDDRHLLLSPVSVEEEYSQRSQR